MRTIQLPDKLLFGVANIESLGSGANSNRHDLARVIQHHRENAWLRLAFHASGCAIENQIP